MQYTENLQIQHLLSSKRVWGSNSFSKWLVWEWFTMFKRIHEVLMNRGPQRMMNFYYFSLVGEASDQVCKGPPLWNLGISDKIHFFLQNEIILRGIFTDTHKYVAGGHIWPPPGQIGLTMCDDYCLLPLWKYIWIRGWNAKFNDCCPVEIQGSQK